jgi:hypothetical protein
MRRLAAPCSRSPAPARATRRDSVDGSSKFYAQPAETRAEALEAMADLVRSAYEKYFSRHWTIRSRAYFAYMRCWARAAADGSGRRRAWSPIFKTTNCGVTRCLAMPCALPASRPGGDAPPVSKDRHAGVRSDDGEESGGQRGLNRARQRGGSGPHLRPRMRGPHRQAGWCAR